MSAPARSASTAASGTESSVVIAGVGEVVRDRHALEAHARRAAASVATARDSEAGTVKSLNG